MRSIAQLHADWGEAQRSEATMARFLAEADPAELDALGLVNLMPDPPRANGEAHEADPAEPRWHEAVGYPEPLASSERVYAERDDPWLVTGLLRPGRFGILAGPEGLGKSYARLELTIRLSTGTGPLFGWYGIPAAVPTLTIDVENGEEEEQRREDDVLAALGLDRSTLAQHYRVCLPGLALTNAADQAYVRRIATCYAPGGLVALDTGSSMVADEWGAELKGAVRFIRSLAAESGAAVLVGVHLVKPVRGNGSRGRKAVTPAQHGTTLSDVMGQWTRQADAVALMSDAGAGRVIWTVRKRVPHHQLVLAAEDGIYTSITQNSGEDVSARTTDRVYTAIVSGADTPETIMAGLEMSRRTVFRHVAVLRQQGRIADGTPFRATP